MYGCKRCGRPLERAIEGELICASCWSAGEEGPEATRAAADQRWYQTHCHDCGRPLPGGPEYPSGGGLCAACRAAWEALLREEGTR